MSTHRRPRPGSGCRGPAGPSTNPERAMALIPAAIVACGAARPPVQRLIGLQSAIGTAVQLAAEVGRVPALLAVHASDWFQRRQERLRAGASVLMHR